MEFISVFAMANYIMMCTDISLEQISRDRDFCRINMVILTSPVLMKIEIITYTCFISSELYLLTICSRPSSSLTLLHSEMPKLYTIFAFLSAIGLNDLDLI